MLVDWHTWIPRSFKQNELWPRVPSNHCSRPIPQELAILVPNNEQFNDGPDTVDRRHRASINICTQHRFIFTSAPQVIICLGKVY